ncbi:MAG: hypothetical protein ACTHYO_03825, partial [Micrococcaceae bacterium]
MNADARNLSTVPADLTPSGGPGDGNPVLAVKDVLAGNGYTAAPTDSDDSETTVDPSSDLGLNAATCAR